MLRISLNAILAALAASVAVLLLFNSAPAAAASSCVATNLLPSSAGPYGCASDYSSLGAFTAPAGNTDFDTDALTYGGIPGGVVAAGAAVYVFDSISIPAGTTVRGVGTRPLVLMSKSTISVSGTIHVNGSSATATAPGCQARTASPPGAGGGGGGLGVAAGAGVGAAGAGTGGGGGPTENSSGGGGAGFGGAGGAGGRSGPGAGGAAYGNLAVALAGGSGGGGGSATTVCPSASGGGGGGALMVSAVGTFVVNAGGAVRANGGGGALSDTGASGAGSGGGLIIVAPVVTNHGTISAAGGQGGPGGCCGGGGSGGGGRILFAGGVVVQGSTSVAGGAATSGSTGGAAGSPGVVSSVVNDPPVVTCGADLSVEATGPAGATVTWSSSHCTANDTETGSLTCAYGLASGGTFALGVTTVTCTATDPVGLTGSDSFDVTVVDTTPPTFAAPANLTVPATGVGGAVVTYSAPGASDVVDGPVTPSCSPPSGSTFPIGVTTVTCSATDSHSNTRTAQFTVTVRPLPELTLTWNPGTKDLEVIGSHPDGIASVTVATSSTTSFLVKSRVYTVTSNAGSVTTLLLDVTHLPALGREEFTLRELRYGVDPSIRLAGGGNVLWGSLGTSVVSLFQTIQVPPSTLLGTYSAIAGRSSMTLNGGTAFVSGIRPFRITSQNGVTTLGY